MHGDPIFSFDRIDPLGTEAEAVGLQRQAMAADLITRGDGWERGVRSVLLQNDRISLEVVVDRGMDIGAARIRQIPIAWRSPTEVVAPWFVENTGFGPHRAFFGGLLTTCGLDHIGPPDERSAEPFGYLPRKTDSTPMHGRYSGSPGRLLGYGVRVTGTELEAYVEGVVTQVAVFGEHLALTRRISIAYGSGQIRIEDQVVNRGYAASPLAVMYHVNAGWPLAAPGARIHVAGTALRGDPDGQVVRAPAPNRPERTWMYAMSGDQAGRSVASIANPHVSEKDAAGLRITWDQKTLPTLVKWEISNVAGHYAIGLEPSTIITSSPRTGDDTRPPFLRLEPGEAAKLGLAIELLHGPAGATLVSEESH